MARRQSTPYDQDALYRRGPAETNAERKARLIREGRLKPPQQPPQQR
jgi:hypothetical protein